MEYSGGKLHLSWQTFLASCTLWHYKALIYAGDKCSCSGLLRVNWFQQVTLRCGHNCLRKGSNGPTALNYHVDYKQRCLGGHENGKPVHSLLASWQSTSKMFYLCIWDVCNFWGKGEKNVNTWSYCRPDWLQTH